MEQNETKTIVTIEQARIPFGTAKGRPTDTVKMVLYSDGSVSYRCGDCDYESDALTSTFAHRTKHAQRKSGKKATQIDNAIRVLSEVVNSAPASEIRSLQRKIERLEERLANSQKARRKAESDLARIRSALAGK